VFCVHVCLLYVWFVCVLFVPSVLWYCWLGLLTCKNRLPYNLYCVGGDVKHCSLTHSLTHGLIKCNINLFKKLLRLNDCFKCSDQNCWLVFQSNCIISVVIVQQIHCVRRPSIWCFEAELSTCCLSTAKRRRTVCLRPSNWSQSWPRLGVTSASATGKTTKSSRLATVSSDRWIMYLCVLISVGLLCKLKQVFLLCTGFGLTEVKIFRVSLHRAILEMVTFWAAQFHWKGSPEINEVFDRWFDSGWHRSTATEFSRLTPGEGL